MMISEEARLRWTVISWSNVPGQVSHHSKAGTEWFWKQMLLAIKRWDLRHNHLSLVVEEEVDNGEWLLSSWNLPSVITTTHIPAITLCPSTSSRTHTRLVEMFRHNITAHKLTTETWKFLEKASFFAENKIITSAALRWQKYNAMESKKNRNSRAQQDHVMKLWFHGTFLVWLI